MNTAFTAPRKMLMNPALLSTLLSITGVIVVAVVAYGQYLSGQQKGWRDLAESRGEEIKDLGRRNEDLEERFNAALAESVKEREFHVVEIAALQGSMALMEKKQKDYEARMDERSAELMRLNHVLQRKLDEASVRQDATDARQDRHEEKG